MTKRIPDDERKERSPLASNVVAARRKLGLEAKDLARAAGMSFQAILNIESGKTLRPHGHNLRAIAEVLETTPDELEGKVSEDLVLDILESQQAQLAAIRKEVRAIAKELRSQ